MHLGALCWRLSVFLTMLCLEGCSSGGARSTIAAIPRNMSDEIWVSELGGASRAASARGLKIYWNGPSRDDDVQPQISLIDRAIRGNNYGVLVSPNNPFALNTLLERALSRRIPVAIVGAETPMPAEKGLFFVLNDVETTGELVADRLNHLLMGHGSVVLLGIDPLSPGSVARAEAIEQALRRIAPQIRIEQKLVGSFSFGQAELASEQAIAAVPGLAAIIALGVDQTSGAAAAVHNTGTAQRIRIIGCDQRFDLLFLLRRGILDSLVIEDTRSMGRIAVERIAAEHQGQPVPARTLVQPRLVTRANVDAPEIQRILDARWRPQR